MWVLVQWVPFLSCPWTSSSLCLPLCPSENSLVSLCSLCSLSSSAFFSLDFFLNHHPRKQKKPQIFKSWLPSLFLKEVALAQWLINNFSHFQSKPTSTHLQNSQSTRLVQTDTVTLSDPILKATLKNIDQMEFSSVKNTCTICMRP